MRRTAAMLCALAACSDWASLSSTYDGPGVCASFAATGDAHSCVRKSNGALYCWGDNRFGELGLGDVSAHAGLQRVDVAGQPVTRVHAPVGDGALTADNAVFACALVADGTLYCWGDNRLSQHGTPDAGPHPSPVAVTALAMKVTKAVSGAGHTCAQTSGDEVYCWGNNDTGQVGSGGPAVEPAPVKVALPADAGSTERLAAGGRFTCARTVASTLWCWGNNELGQLGTGDQVPHPTPVRATALAFGVSRVSAGRSHVCATDSGGAVYCWGDNRYGQLGTGDRDGSLSPRPVGAGMLPPIASIQAGGRHTCGVGTDGTLWCWGDNQYGQLGSASPLAQLSPVQVSPEQLGNQVGSVSTGGAHTCAVKIDGSLYCFGDDQYGQLGPNAGGAPLNRVFPPCK